MKLREFFEDVLQVSLPPGDRDDRSGVPSELATLYQANSKLDDGLLKTDIRILQESELYKVARYTVFAEEAQCVVRWGYDQNNVSRCFSLDHEVPVNAFLEEFNLEEMLLGMLVNNANSSSLMENFDNMSLSLEHAKRIIASHTVVGGFANVKAIVENDVLCAVEMDSESFLCATSQSKQNLAAFMSRVTSL